MAKTSETSYAYGTLKHPDSIRILELLPGTPDMELECRILEVRRRDRPQFEAISYTWGTNPIFRRRIKEVGSDTYIRITNNLYNALKVFRFEDASRSLWVDAVCIDQQDGNAEKNHQVAQMANIYRDATTVLAWLGKKDASDAIAQLTEVGENEAFYSRPRRFDLDRFKRLVLEVNLVTLINFFEREWFRRIWIIQEMVLAQDLVLFAGTRSIPITLLNGSVNVLWDLLYYMPLRHSDMNQILEENGATIEELLDQLQSLVLLLSLRNRYLAGYITYDATKITTSPILDMLQEFCNFKCALRRDRLYAILGLVEDNLSIMPNYDIPEEMVWRDLAIRLLMRGNLHVLQCALSPTIYAGTCSFTPPVENILYPSRVVNYPRSPMFTAGSHSPPSVEMLGEFALRLSGVYVDVVARGGDVEEAKSFDEHVLYRKDLSGPMHHLENLYEDCRRMYSSVPCPYDETFTTAFARTMVTDNSLPYSKVLLPSDSLGPDQWPVCLVLYLWHRRLHDRILVPHQRVAKLLGPSRFEVEDDKGTHLERVPYKFPSTQSSATKLSIENDPDAEEYIELTGPLKTYAMVNYPRAVASTLKQNAFFVTSKGYLGIGPRDMQPGDVIAIFDGASTPFVLRQWNTNGSTDLGLDKDCTPRYKIVGDCYLHGWMDGNLCGHEVVDEGWTTVTSHKNSKNKGPQKGQTKILKRTSFILC